MSVDNLVAAGRARAESLMRDQCLIRRRTGEVTDPATGVITPTYATVYSGKCKVQQHAAQGRTENAGEALLIMNMRELHLPVASSTGVRRDDEIAITASAGDPDLLGRTMYVRDLAGKSHATARRLIIQERT